MYVSKWRDKRDVLCITTKLQPGLIVIQNAHGKTIVKPKEVVDYNLKMAGVDRNDQLVSCYNCPRKSIRWYKIKELLGISANIKDGRKIVKQGAMNCTRSRQTPTQTPPEPVQHFLGKNPLPENYS